MKKEYHITVNSANNKLPVIATVDSLVVRELKMYPKSFVVKCNEDELATLENNELVVAIEPMDITDESVSEEQSYSPREVRYIRRQKLGVPTMGTLYDDDDLDTTDRDQYNYNNLGPTEFAPPLGNWGLLRHTSATANLARDIGATGTYTAPSYNGTSLDGTGVDLILNIASVVHPDDPEFKDDGVSRVQQFQWNSLPLRYAEDGVDHSAGDLVLDSEGNTQLNDVNTVYWNEGGDETTLAVGAFDFDANTLLVGPAIVQDLAINDLVRFKNPEVNGTGSTLFTQGLLTPDQDYFIESFVDNDKIRLKSSTTTLTVKNLSQSTALNANASAIMVRNIATVELDDINEHAEAVAYIACSNTYGWATGANIYIWPRDQMAEPGDANDFQNVARDAWDSFRLFHQNKIANGNLTPTLVLDSIGSRKLADLRAGNTTAICFRNNVYTEVAPGGAREFHVRGYNQLQGKYAPTGAVYGDTATVQYSGKYLRTPFTSDGFVEPPITQEKEQYLLSEIATEKSDVYNSHIKPLELMTASGVHHIASAGNYRSTIALPDGIDFNNGTFASYAYNDIDIGKFEPTNRPGYYSFGDTLLVGSLSGNYRNNQFDNKEVMSEFSCRGEAVDTIAAGDSIFVDLYKSGNYALYGTSFSSPQVGGMACLVLQIYPSTTPRQLRRFFRFHAVGTDRVYESGTQPLVGSKFGDAPFFNDTYGTRGYGGHIAYLDTNANNWTDPRTLSDGPILSSLSTFDNRLDFTIDEINSKLTQVESGN